MQALELLVDLYLDPDIASPRKVSVWYSFWGEASSRQEYYDICGKKDEDFAALVRELMERLIAHDAAQRTSMPTAWRSGSSACWRCCGRGSRFRVRPISIAPPRVRRSLQLSALGVSRPNSPTPRRLAPRRQHRRRRRAAARRLPAAAYADAALLAAEREQLLRPAWQLLGHEAELRARRRLPDCRSGRRARAGGARRARPAACVPQ